MEVLEVKALLKIRSFEKGFDEQAYVRIYNTCFRDYDDIRSMTLDELREMEEFMSFSTDGVLIAEWNGEIAGMVNAYVDKQREEPKGFIQSLAVVPEFRGKGIATRLVEKAIESLRQRGMKTAEVWTQTDRKTCMRVFEGFGFKQARLGSVMKRIVADVPSNTGENNSIKMRQIRPKNDGDILLVNRLDNEAFKEHFNYRPRSLEETKHMLSGLPFFKQQDGYFAVLDGQPVGYVIVGIDAELNEEKKVKYGWILDIGVLKPYRRMGIGMSLMLAGLQWIRLKHMDEAWLYVDDLNPTGAFKLYAKLDFEVAKKNLAYQLEIPE